MWKSYFGRVVCGFRWGLSEGVAEKFLGLVGFTVYGETRCFGVGGRLF